MYGCESWTIKKAKCQRIDAFELWCWRRCLRVLWTAKRSNQSILKEISPEYSLEGWMLKLKLQYFGHLMRRTDSFEKTLCWKRLRAGGKGDDRGWNGWMASPTQQIWVLLDSGSWWWTGRPGMLQFMRSQRVGHNWVTELNWTELNDTDNYDGVVTQLELDILKCKVKWTLGSITTNKASGGDGTPAELFQILKDDATEMLYSVCQ